MSIPQGNSYFKVLNTKNYGIPQNRERVFTISIRKDIDNKNFEFPQPFELTIKLRVLYKRKKIEWDGYYYFALSDSQYEAYKAQQNKRGRRRKEFQFGAVFLYEILDECKINEYYRKYIFRVPFITRLKQKYFIRDFTSSQAELILVREPLKFKDIIVYDNEYEFI